MPKAQLGSWGKGSSGGAKASELGESGQPSPSALLRARSGLGWHCRASGAEVRQDQPFPSIPPPSLR